MEYFTKINKIRISQDDVKRRMKLADYRRGFCTGLYIGSPHNLSDEHLIAYGRDLIAELYAIGQLLQDELVEGKE